MSNPNSCSPLTLNQRLCCLLAVTENEANTLIRGGRMAPDSTAIARRVGREKHEVDHILSSRTEIENARIDANTVTQLQLLQVPSLSPERIRPILEGRPYFSLLDFEETAGLPRARIEELFSVPELELKDKITGKITRYEPVLGEYITRPRLEFESSRIIESLGYIEQQAGPGAPLRVIVPSETEAPKSSFELKRALGGQVFPVLRDAEGFKHYFVFAMIDVWFNSNVTRQQALSMLHGLGLRVVDSRAKVGYYQAELGSYPADLHVMAATLEKIRDIQVIADIDFAEPTEVGYEDFSPENEAFLPEFESTVSGSRMWNLEMIELEAAHTMTEGSSDVSILVIDSGIRTDHQDLSDAMRPDWASLDLNFDIGVPEAELSPAELDIAHGTSVASVAGGRGGAGEYRVHGVAPQCWILPFKVSGSPFGQSYGLRAAAIREAVNTIDSGKHGVLNLSWSTSGEHRGVREALFMASEKGLAIVTSAGNYQVVETQTADKPHYPSGYALMSGDTQDDIQARRKIVGLVSVAAVNAFNRKASYSYYGARSVTVSAPGGELGQAGMGVFVASTPAHYSYNAGTSFAAPQVAGLMALLWSAKTNLSAEQVIEVLRSTATNLDGDNPGYSGMLGAGLINARAALESLGLSASSSVVPAVPEEPEDHAGGVEHKININAASAQDLVALPHIGEWSAQTIVAYRTTNGPFATIWDLTNTGALDHWVVDQIKNLITAGPLSSGESSSVSTDETPQDASADTTLNINTATADELNALPLIGLWSAMKIIAYRNDHGMYASIWDLALSGAIDNWTIAQIKDLIGVT